MRKLLFLITLLISAQSNSVFGQANININFTPANICPGDSITITMVKSGVYYTSGNSFQVQLSDAAGSFAAPVTLGTINDTIPDTVFTIIPRLTAAGAGYKIRVVTTSPSTTFVSTPSLNVYAKPTVAFSVLNDNQCFKWNLYNFSSSSSIGSGSISSYVWDWGDGSLKDTVATTTISHKFKTFFASYSPILTVVSNLGCKDTASRKVLVRETPVVLTEFNDTIQCFRGNQFTILSRTTTLSGSIVLKTWDIGDGTIVPNNTDSIVHHYANAGTYTVRQINEHSNGCIDTGYLSGLVNTHPVAIIATNDTDQCILNNAFVFEAKSTITNGLPLLNSWDIDDGLVFPLQDSVHHSYSPFGNRTIQLITASDDGFDGCSDTTYQTILVNPMPKAVVNNLDMEKCENYNVFRFTAKSTIGAGTISHNWDFGDLSTASNVDSVSHSYASSGNYTIKLRAVSAKGCMDSTTTSVIVRPSPVPGFTIAKDTQCLKYNLFRMYSTSTITSGTFTKLWLISDGKNYIDVDSIKHTFSNFGKFGVELIVKSAYNCADTTYDSVTVLPMPASSFTVDDADQCFEGNKYTFTDNSTFPNGTLTGNKWLYGDGNTASNQSGPVHSYTAEAGYKVALIVYGDNGCLDTSFQDVKVYPHPASDFLINDTGQCVNNNSFRFLNNTFISEGSFSNRWFFGDGTNYVDAIDILAKKYFKDSMYKVTVISFSDQGCTDTASHTVTVFPKAKTNFTIDNAQQCRLGNMFTFTSTTTLKRGTYTLAWQFGDGNVDGNVPSVQHSYTGVQTYSIKLISATNEGCLDTLTKTVRTLAMPVANFTFNYDKKCLTGNDFQFNASSTVAGNAPMTHRWFYGDNDSLINSTFAQHSYTTYGAYTVTLISSTNVGNCRDTTSKNMTVFPMPKSSFVIDDDAQCFLGNQFQFTSTSGVPTGTINTTNWTFGDNTTSSLPDPTKSYNKVDSFRVTLTTITDNGCSDSTFKKVYIFPMPEADFNISPKSSCLLKNIYKITNKSKITNGFISKYQFYYDFGNPNTDSSLLQTPADYSYKASGDYTILLRTTTDKGCWDTATRQISINPNPVLDFDVAAVCLKDSSVFVNKSTVPGSGTIASWKWIFGNGKTSTLQSPSHKYKAVGSYDITLIAATDKGCVDTLKKLGFAVVKPNPKADFTYQKIRSWENEVDIQYIDSSKGAVAWNWNFASMGSSTDQNPKLYYVDTLTQTTTLVVTNIEGCRDTITKVLFITPDVIYYMPNAFTPNDDNINETFKPRGLAYAINYKFIIFNRWGEILFSTDNPQLGWDGKYENKPVEQDLYFYRLEFVGADELRHEEKGNVMILR